jgi:hypothetical protein
MGRESRDIVDSRIRAKLGILSIEVEILMVSATTGLVGTSCAEVKHRRGSEVDTLLRKRCRSDYDPHRLRVANSAYGLKTDR